MRCLPFASGPCRIINKCKQRATSHGSSGDLPGATLYGAMAASFVPSTCERVDRSVSSCPVGVGRKALSRVSFRVESGVGGSLPVPAQVLVL